MQAYTSPRGYFRFPGKLALWSLGVVVVAAIVLTGFFYNRHQVTIHADGKNTAVIMRGGTVKDAIKKANVAVGPNDVIDPPLSTSLTQDQDVKISRRIKVHVVADGKNVEQWVAFGTVGETLKTLKVSLNEKDTVTPELTERVVWGDTIEVIRHKENLIYETTKIPFKTEQRKDASMEKGRTKIVTNGREGLLQKTIKITYKNGKEVSREVVGQKTLRESVNKVVALGTQNVKVVSRGGSIRYSRSLKMNASAYSHTGRNTASGVYPYKGAVAVDPRVIPLGSKLYIEGYGYAKALDIGSSIKGNRVDLFFDSNSQALRWGRRTVTVYILE